jgi:hypothetical protein
MNSAARLFANINYRCPNQTPLPFLFLRLFAALREIKQISRKAAKETVSFYAVVTKKIVSRTASGSR